MFVCRRTFVTVCKMYSNSAYEFGILVYINLYAGAGAACDFIIRVVDICTASILCLCCNLWRFCIHLCIFMLVHGVC